MSREWVTCFLNSLEMGKNKEVVSYGVVQTKDWSLALNSGLFAALSTKTVARSSPFYCEQFLIVIHIVLGPTMFD